MGVASKARFQPTRRVGGCEHVGMTETPDRLTIIAFSTAILIGGVNFVAVRVSNQELDPMFGAGLRFSAAALIFLAFVAVRRIPLPRGRVLAVTVAYGVLAFTITYALAYWSLQPGKLSAGIGAVIFGATPLITILLAAAHRLERITPRGVFGALIAVAGITVLANPFSDASVPVVPLLAMLIGAVAAAESGVILKLVPPSHPVSTNGLAMAIGAVLLLGISAVAGEAWLVPEQGDTWTALAYLAPIGSVGLFALFLFTLGRWTASAVAYMTAAFPVVAMVAGAVLLDEEITANGVIGGAMVITAVYVGAIRRTPQPAQGSSGVM